MTEIVSTESAKETGPAQVADRIVNEAPDQVRFKEEILWTEMQSLRELMLRLAQWGVTVMVALQTIIYYVRRDIVERLVAAKQLPVGSSVPLDRWVIGFVVLCLVATMFTAMTVLLAKQWRSVRSQLSHTSKTGSGIAHKPFLRIPGRWWVIGVYYTFPLMDLFIRVYVFVEVKFV